MSEPTPSLPPQIPTRSLKPVVFGLAGVAVAVAIGVGWKLSQSSGETPAPKPEASAPAPAPPPARDVAPAPRCTHRARPRRREDRSDCPSGFGAEAGPRQARPELR